MEFQKSGIDAGEDKMQALFREVKEKVGCEIEVTDKHPTIKPSSHQSGVD